jgi:hypothetical protein
MVLHPDAVKAEIGKGGSEKRDYRYHLKNRRGRLHKSVSATPICRNLRLILCKLFSMNRIACPFS